MKLRRVTYRMLVLIVGMILSIILLSPGVAFAQTKTLVWHRWDADIQINTDGTFRVREVFEIEFLGGPFTFGFRNIPIEKYDSLTEFRVQESGVDYEQRRGEAANTFYVDQSGSEYVVNWFYPATVNATRIFTVEYVVHGGLAVYDSGDRLFWKAVGPEHDFPIESSHVVVHAPPGAVLDASVPPYFSGNNASTSVSADGTAATYDSVNVPASQYFEVGTIFTHGVIPAVKPSWQAADDANQEWNQRWRPVANLALGALALILLIVGLGGVYLLWLVRGKDPDVGVVPSYLAEPPSDLPPGVAGTLIDEKADLQDIIATVVDLARRGVIEMEEKEKKIFGITASKDFVFRRQGGEQPAGLRRYETLLLKEMFGSRNEIDLDDLQEKFYSAIPKLQNELYRETVAAGLFPASPGSVRGRYLGLGIIGLVLSVGAGFCASAAYVDRIDAILCPFIALGVASVTMLIVSRVMPVKTRAGAEEAAKWRAFQKYLSNAEKYGDLASVTERFDQYLPYAVAFGLERTWINKFSRVPTTPVPRWYVPIGGRPYFGANDADSTMRGKTVAGSGGRDLRGAAVKPGASLEGMSDRMASGLSGMSGGLMSMLNSTASTFTSVPRSSGSSGGFSGGGGGFSGGGGGGGGGAGFG